MRQRSPSRRVKSDLFLLDVFLPDMTAMELIPQLKALQ
jgi:response regulator of citrate/malate metabolism